MDNKKIDIVMKEIKEQIKPSDELINKTISRVRKIQEEKEYKKIKTRRVLTSVIGTFTALVIVAEGASFAFNKQNIFSMLFSNVDKGIETAIEYGNIKNVNMDYIEIADGLKMKVEFVLMNQYNFDVVFKFDGIKEYCKKNNLDKIEQICFSDLVIKNNEDKILFSDLQCISTFVDLSSVNIDNYIYTILHAYSVDDNFPFESTTDLNINFTKLHINKSLIINNFIDINLNISEFNIDNKKIEYSIKDLPEYIEDYNIILSSTNLKVELFFKEKYNKIDKTKTKLKDNKRNVYLPNDNFKYSNNYLLLVFPISDYQEVNNLELKLNLDGKTRKIILIRQK